jgi:hypothetical protein
VFAPRREGRDYAHAVTQFSSAVTAWLTFVDKQLHPVQEITRDEQEGQARRLRTLSLCPARSPHAVRIAEGAGRELVYSASMPK